MPNVLRARSHQQAEADSVSGPSSYASGTGFSIRSNLGRVDEVDVEIDNASWEARASVADDNAIVAQFYSQGSGTEVADATDLSADTVHWTAHRL